MQHIEIAPKGSTAIQRYVARNFEEAGRVAIEFQVEAVGATPTITFNIQGLRPNGDPSVAADWTNLATLTGDSTVAASNAAIVTTTVGFTTRYIDGLAERFYSAYAINVTANTNVTFSARAYMVGTMPSG